MDRWNNDTFGPFGKLELSYFSLCVENNILSIYSSIWYKDMCIQIERGSERRSLVLTLDSSWSDRLGAVHFWLDHTGSGVFHIFFLFSSFGWVPSLLITQWDRKTGFYHQLQAHAEDEFRGWELLVSFKQIALIPELKEKSRIIGIHQTLSLKIEHW